MDDGGGAHRLSPDVARALPDRRPVYALLTAAGISQGDTARLALVPALARLAHMPVERLNARDRAIVRLGSVLGPFLAGFLIAGIGAVNVLFVDAGTFSISALLVAAGIPRSVDARERRPVEDERRRYFAELADGLRFVRSTAFLLSMILVATVGNFFLRPAASDRR